jgi:hypothetical protein
VRPFVVVLLAPLLDQASCLEQAGEKLAFSSLPLNVSL